MRRNELRGARRQRLPTFIAALAAWTLDTVSGAAQSYWTGPLGGSRAELAGSPVHMAEMAVLALLGLRAGSRASAGAMR